MSVHWGGRGPGHVSRLTNAARPLYARLLAEATLDFDFLTGTGQWDGQARTTSDLTAVTGGYTLTNSAGITTDATVLVEYLHNHAATVSGTLFSWVGTSSQRVELLPYNIDTNRKLSRWYLPLSTGADYVAPPYNSKAGEGGTVDGRGIRRIISRLSNAQSVSSMVGPSDLATTGAVLGTFNAVTKLGFGVAAWNSAAPLTNSILRRVTIWNRRLTETEMSALNAYSATTPIHFLGDSFLNNYKVAEFTKVLLEASGSYVPVSQDGVGGTSLTQESVRFASNNAKWHDSTLVIMDGGLDYAVGEPQSTQDEKKATNLAAIQSITSTLNHDRWIYVGAAPNDDAGTPTRILWDDMQDYMRTICGSHYVESLAPIQALSDGGVDDTAYVARGIWPLSTRTSSSDFHPNTKGQNGLAAIIRDALQARGWA